MFLIKVMCYDVIACVERTTFELSINNEIYRHPFPQDQTKKRDTIGDTI